MKPILILIFSLLLSGAYAQKLSKKMLIVDLNPDKGVIVKEDDLVEQWQNQVTSFTVKDFSRRDE